MQAELQGLHRHLSSEGAHAAGALHQVPLPTPTAPPPPPLPPMQVAAGLEVSGDPRPFVQPLEVTHAPRPSMPHALMMGPQ